MFQISIVFTFCLLESRGQNNCTNIFHRKTKYLIISNYFIDIVLARNQVFSVQFLLRDIKHDTIFVCRKISSCCLVLVFNVVNKSFMKSFAISGKLYIDLQKRISWRIAVLKLPGKQVRKFCFGYGYMAAFRNRNIPANLFLGKGFKAGIILHDLHQFDWKRSFCLGKHIRVPLWSSPTDVL